MNPTMEAQKEAATKALYTALGAPVVTGRKLRHLGARIAGDLATETEVWEAEGRKLTGQIQESKVVEQVQSRVDVDQLQEQVEKLRDQLEGVLANWRHGFKPNGSVTTAKPPAAVEHAAKPAAKPAARKATPKKATARKPATRKPAARKPAATKTS